MKNLLFLHLESISWQRFWSFRSAFTHSRALVSKAQVLDTYLSSATSTLMVVSYLAHGSDFEFDAEPRFEAMQAAGNLPHLFSVLGDHGYARPTTLTRCGRPRAASNGTRTASIRAITAMTNPRRQARRRTAAGWPCAT